MSSPIEERSFDTELTGERGLKVERVAAIVRRVLFAAEVKKRLA
jgi:hypothetical protein